MRILLPIIQFPPDVNTTGLLMAQLCEELALQGHEISVVTSFPHYEKFRIREEYRGRLFERERYEGTDVLRVFVYAPGKKSMRNRLISYLSFSAAAGLAGVLSRKSWDLILCTNGGFFTGVASWLIGAAKGIPFIYNVQDLYPEVPVLAGQLRDPRAISILKRIESFMYRKACHVTVISDAMRENLLGKGVPERKISVIPNFVDTEFIRPLPKRNDVSEKLGLADKFVVMHSGNLGYVYDLETLLSAAAHFVGQRDILFLIVGDGVAKATLQRKADALDLSNVRFLPFQPRESLPWLRASADVQLSLYKRGAAQYSMPSKIYEIMASGRPLLASADAGSDVWKLVNLSRCGLWVEPERPEQLAQAISTLYQGPGLREELAQNGRLSAEKNYSKQAAGQSYHRLIEELAKKRNGGALKARAPKNPSSSPEFQPCSEKSSGTAAKSGIH